MIQQSTYKTSTGFFIFLSAIFLICLVAALYSFYYWLIILPFVIIFFYWGWQQWQTIFFLLIFSLPWSVEYNFNSSLGTDLPDEPLMLALTSLFTAFCLFKPSELVKVWRHPLIFFLLLHLSWIVVTIFFSTDWLLSLKFFLAKTWYLGAFVLAPIIFFRSKRTIKITGLCFLISMMAVTILSLFRHYQLGLTFATINDAVAPFFRNHVNYSAMMVCIIPVMVSVFQLHKKSRMLIITGMVIVLSALFFSYARGAWLALVVGGVSYLLIIKKKLFITFILFMSLVIGAIFWVKGNDRYLQYAHNFKTTIFHKNFEEHLVATYKLKDLSTAERFNRWIAGIRMVKDKWATGYGPNTFYKNYKPYTIPAFKTWVSENKEHSTVHNYFLLTTIEQGLPGLLFFLILLGGMLFYSEKLYHRVNDSFYRSVVLATGVILSMSITVNFLSDLIEADKIGSLFFLCLAVLVAVDLNTRSETWQIPQ